jgi:hypothetical protein
MARRTNINNVDIFATNDVLPVSCVFLPLEMIGDSFYFGFISPADHLQHWFVGHIEETPHLSPRIAMGASHETVANHCDV